MDNSGKSTPGSCSSCGAWWRLPLMLALVLGAMLLLRGRAGQEATPPADRNAPEPGVVDGAKVVYLGVDMGSDERPQYEPIAWREGQTVRDLVLAAPGDTFSFVERGTGESALLTALNETANEGPGGRNWTYTVNGRLADRSFAVYELQAGDRVLWSFAAPD